MKLPERSLTSRVYKEQELEVKYTLGNNDVYCASLHIPETVICCDVQYASLQRRRILCIIFIISAHYCDTHVTFEKNNNFILSHFYKGLFIAASFPLHL